MKANKIGILFVVAVLGLAGIGASYAGFTDTITITGTATTGTVDMEVVAISGTWVWKDVVTHEKIVHHDWANANGNDPATATWTPADDYDVDGGDQYTLVAYATGWMDGDDKIILKWDNLFPFQDDVSSVYENEDGEYKDTIPIDTYVIDIIFHYNGKIPARLEWPATAWIDYEYENGEDMDGLDDGWLEELMINGYVNAHAYRIKDNIFSPDDTNLPECHLSTLAKAPHDYSQLITMLDPWYKDDIKLPGEQVHYCDYIKLDILFDVPQDDEVENLVGVTRENFQGLGARGYIELSVIQFDEYVDPGFDLDDWISGWT